MLQTTSQRLRRIGSCAAAAVLAATAGLAVPAQAGASAAAGHAEAGHAEAGHTVWLYSLQMTSASTGWALRWTGNPAEGSPHLVPARTTDGGRTWATVTPPGASSLLSSLFSSAVLYALSGTRAWLAVTKGNATETGVNRTEVYTTANGGRTWTTSALLRVQGFVQFLTAPDPRHGWLLEDLGEESAGGIIMAYAVIYRTTDGGLHWSRVAATEAPPGIGVSKSGIPVQCDKAGLTFATAEVGWLAGACPRIGYALRVSRDGGTHWAEQSLGLPSDTCVTYGCQVYDPQFFGQTGFVTLVRPPATPYFLTSSNLGVTWRTEGLPSGGGTAPRIQFFSPRDGVLVSAGSQGAIGSTFYTSANGGRTWTAVPQGHTFSQSGAEFDFVSPEVGFAWTIGADAPGSRAPQMYQTSNSGKTWTAFEPKVG
jgi:photosystem II stability/assembly factor-like uncharacterized protein